MSLEVYNQLMSDMLNQKHVLAKLRTELEGREGRLCRCCERFGHFAQMCRSGEEQKKKIVVENKFEMLKNQVMQCGMRVVRRQEVMREVVKCFECGEEGHKKWECLRKRKERKREKEVPPCKVWDKVKEHSGTRGLPPREAAMYMKGWTMPREVVTFVKYRRYNYKGTKTEENKGQGFL